MKKKTRKNSISRTVARMTVQPLILIALLTFAIIIAGISYATSREVRSELDKLAHITWNNMDRIIPGELTYQNTDSKVEVTKGDTTLLRFTSSRDIIQIDSDYLDAMKEISGVDYTLFLHNIDYTDIADTEVHIESMRVCTTLFTPKDSDGTAEVRLVGTVPNDAILTEVDQRGHAFYSNVDVMGTRYYGYYLGLTDADGKDIGMFAAVMPSTQIRSLILSVSLPVVPFFVLAIVLNWFWSYYRSRDFLKAITQLERSLVRVAGGELSNTVPPALLARKDEFAEMGHSVIDMQKSLRTLVEQDALTKLNNRRFGQQRLDAMFEKTRGNSSFSVALGDIDFFKKFNDTYGHDCGDIVLIEVAQVLQHTIQDFGYCIRWGGEEFLIVFTKGSFEQHKEHMQTLIETIRGHVVRYQELELSVTMTFGLIDTAGCESTDEIVKKVDDLLYEGKENGRNQLVTPVS